MDISLSAWFVLLLALLAANLPFVNRRIFGVIPFKSSSTRPGKPFWLCLVELMFLYIAVGAIAYALELRTGEPTAQHWEFYAVTSFLFLVLAYPGFVFRYLRKRPG